MNRIPNTTVLEKAKCSSIHALLSQGSLRYAEWENEGFQKGTRKTGCPILRFKDVCKRGIKPAAIDFESWELMVKDRSTWWHPVKVEIKHAEQT